MNIKKIEINNFRLLKNLSLDLEQNLSLIVGKNNTGKTSILSILDRFLNSNTEKKKFYYEDLSISLQKEFHEIIENEKTFPSEAEFEALPLAEGISLLIFIEYDAQDDLSLLQPLIMNPEVDDNQIILSFELRPSYKRIKDMREEYNSRKKDYGNDSLRFIKSNFSNYFGQLKRKSLLSTDASKFLDLDEHQVSLKDIINFEYIGAKRDVTNKDNNKTLSAQTSRIYKDLADDEAHNAFVDELKTQLIHTDIELDQTYNNVFQGVLNKVAKYGGIKNSETKIKITSTLQSRDLLDNNTTVIYSHDSQDLPEFFNGLGYMNLISIIFDIEIMMSKLRRTLSVKPAAINLIFIEEPEAHTHPQMQYVFINNIKALLNEARLRDDGIKIHLQTVISTHSSHIVSECDFNDIKYLKRLNHEIEAKNLRQLEGIYSTDDVDRKNFKFLKQYLTLNRSEIFFADKSILIEGDTERILLPAFMKKIDQEVTMEDSLPLLSQNISVIEVGAHAQTFERFLDFIGIKSLLITDIDSNYKTQDTDDAGKPKVNEKGEPVMKTIHCCPNDPSAHTTSNSSLSYFHKTDEIAYFKKLKDCTQKTFKKVGNDWLSDADGILCTVFQTEQDGYHGRSFEDAFFHLNKSFLIDNKDNFPSLTDKHLNKFVNGETTALEFSEKAIGSKPSLAIEILLNSKVDAGKYYSNWQVPAYIWEGLVWLAKN